MKIILVFLSLVFTQVISAQCWKRLGEVQDTSIYSYFIEENGTLFKLEPNQNWDNTILSQIFPTHTNWERIFNGSSNKVFALKTDSTLWGWSDNPGPQNAPIQVGNEKWIDFSFLYARQCGIKEDGTLWLWDETINAPTQYGVDNDWKDIEIREDVIVGIKNDGSLWYSTINITTPLFNQLGVGQTWIFVDLTSSSFYAINSNHQLYLWSNLSNPPMLINSNVGWKEVSCNDNLLNSGLKLDGTVFYWENYNPINPIEIIPNQILGISNINEIDNNTFGILSLSNTQLYRCEDNLFSSGSFNVTNIGETCLLNNGSIEIIPENYVLVYPNPTSEKAYLEVLANLIGRVYQITDFTGKLIQSDIIKETNQEINLKDVSTGVYFISIENQAKKVKINKL